MNTDTKKQEQTKDVEHKNDKLLTTLRQENLELKTKIRNLEIKTLEVHKQNEMMKSSDVVSSRMAELEYDLKLAEHLVNSGALPSKRAEHAYIIMKAGEEMGMKPLEAMRSLYIVNGQISAWGKGMISILTKNGYEIDYSNESSMGVDVTISKGLFLQSYRVDRKSEEALQKSKAMSFASKNKMRYHGVRQIINFHLPHLFGAVSLIDQDDIDSAEKRAGTYEMEYDISQEQIEQILSNLENCENIEEISTYYNSLDSTERVKEVKAKAIEKKRFFINEKRNEND